MILNENFNWRVKPVFILGKRASFLSRDGTGFVETDDRYKQEALTEDILRRLDLIVEEKLIVRKDEDLAQLDSKPEVFLVFVHTMNRFRSLVTLAKKGLPVILTGEEQAPGDALDSYQFLSGYDNVMVAFGFDEVRKKVRVLRAAGYVRRARVCIFDSGERRPESEPWLNNPLLNGILNAEIIDLKNFEEIYRDINLSDAASLADNWMGQAEVREPGREDVTRTAAMFLAMKQVINGMRANAAYVLWCAQFNDLIRGKMCLSIAKLNDAGYLTGCWRGENMLPMMLLHALTDKPVFFGEVHTLESNNLSVRHCAVPASLTNKPLVLRRWRNKEGSVTGFCEMPRGYITLVNAGKGDHLTVIEGEVVDVRDIGGSNCRTTVWLRLNKETPVDRLWGREMALVYGSYSDEVTMTSEYLNIKTS